MPRQKKPRPKRTGKVTEFGDDLSLDDWNEDDGLSFNDDDFDIGEDDE